MNEKEFITKAIEHIDRKWNGIIPNYEAVDEWLDEYLAEFHREYHGLSFRPRLKPLNMVDDRTREQKILDGDVALPPWCEEHEGLRFRADDPNQEKLGMAINYKCVHGVEWTVTGACIDALRLSQFNHCDCDLETAVKESQEDHPRIEGIEIETNFQREARYR
jgi:hypothetical protein